MYSFLYLEIALSKNTSLPRGYLYQTKTKMCLLEVEEAVVDFMTSETHATSFSKGVYTVPFATVFVRKTKQDKRENVMDG